MNSLFCEHLPPKRLACLFDAVIRYKPIPMVPGQFTGDSNKPKRKLMNTALPPTPKDVVPAQDMGVSPCLPCWSATLNTNSDGQVIQKKNSVRFI